MLSRINSALLGICVVVSLAFFSFLTYSFFAPTKVAAKPQSFVSPSAPDLYQAPQKALQLQGDTSFAYLNSSEAFDAGRNETFLVSFLVQFDALPRVGSRQQILSKYAGSEYPYPGWAVALHRLKTSTRPAVFWRGEDGTGGWYAFDEFSFSTKTWYAVTLIVRPNQSLSLFVESLSTRLGESTERQVVFAGGHDISQVKTPESSANMYLGTRHSGHTSFNGQLAHILIAYPQMLPTTFEGLQKTLAGGPASIIRNLGRDKVALWIGDSGNDESPYTHSLKLNSAKWVQ